MSNTRARNGMVSRRGELLAELFLEELKPEFVARPTGDFAYDFFVGFPNAKGGINNIAVEVKATEGLVRERYRIPRQQYERWAHSNIPVLVLVIDVKEKRYYYAWPSPGVSDGSGDSDTLLVDLTEIDEVTRKELRERLAG